MSDQIKKSLSVLLAEIVDYAGLFPPSAVSMAEAVHNFSLYQNSRFDWMLGRFVVPVERLDEFAAAAQKFFTGVEKIWKLSVLASADVDDAVQKIESFNREFSGKAVADTIELKAKNLSEIENADNILPKNFDVYFELPLAENLGEMVSTLAVRDRRAKIRAGGITPEAFPPASEITRFMRTCLAANVPFKCTAGLHHPVRCQKPLTYEADAPEGMMNGFLNVFLAAAFLREGYKANLINELLEDEWAKNFTFDQSGVTWRQEYFVGIEQLKALRARGAISFGSCSFTEPVEDLRELELL